MSIRPGDIGSVEIDTAVGTTVSETYNPATHLEYSKSARAGATDTGTYAAASTQSDPEPLPLQ